MKNISYIILAIVMFVGCKVPSVSKNGQDDIQVIEDLNSDNSVLVAINGDILFTTNDAEKILGEPAHLSDRSMTTLKRVFSYKSTFSTDTNEVKKGTTGNVYFMVEQYAQDSSAKRVYAEIKSANENHDGIKTLNDLGDEAYFHTDSQNFYFILVRKGVKIVRLKVNKITKTTSLDAFYEVVKNITNVI